MLTFFNLWPNWGSTLYGEVRGASDYKRNFWGMAAAVIVTTVGALVFFALMGGLMSSVNPGFTKVIVPGMVLAIEPMINAGGYAVRTLGNGWTVVTSEIGYIPKNYPELTDTQRAEAGEFLQTLEDHDDVHRVWAAIKS